jgi:hypothetical protein
MDAEDIIAVAESMGLRNLAALLRNGPAGAVAALVAEINDALREDEEAAPAALTDRQAWKRLEGLAGSVGASKGWPKELIDALKRVFAERAAA